MIKEFKDKWVQALRSGHYKQGHGGLKNEVGHCCLGVLCDVMAQAGHGKWTDSATQKGGLFSYQGQEKGGYLPLSLLHLVELDEQLETRLAVMNDAGQNFEEIADYIEDHA